MPENWVGLTAAMIILSASALVLMLNLAPDPEQPSGPPGMLPARHPDSQRVRAPGVGLIGEEAGRNRLTIRAGYRPAPPLAGRDPSPESTRLEVEVLAEPDNPQAFPPGSFVPYLQLGYRIEPPQGGAAIEEGTLKPALSRGGMHYGATVKPAPGSYRLVLKLAPPGDSVDRAADEATGVSAWWEPFQVAFPWEYAGTGEPNP